MSHERAAFPFGSNAPVWAPGFDSRIKAVTLDHHPPVHYTQAICVGTFSFPHPFFSLFLRLSAQMHGNRQILKIVCSGGSVKLFRHCHEQNVSSGLNFLLEPAEGNLPSPLRVCKGRLARGQAAGLLSTAQRVSVCWLFSASCKCMPYYFKGPWARLATMATRPWPELLRVPLLHLHVGVCPSPRFVFHWKRGWLQ